MLLYSGWREHKRIPSNSSVLYESRRKDREQDSWPYYFWAAGCWGGMGLQYQEPGLWGDTDLGLEAAGLSDLFTDAVDLGDGGGGEVFGGCGGCGGCGGDTGGMSGGKKNCVSKLSLKVTFTLSIFHKC